MEGEQVQLQNYEQHKGLVIELFSILTVAVNTSTYSGDKLYRTKYRDINRSKTRNLNKIDELYQCHSVCDINTVVLQNVTFGGNE